MTTTEAMSTSSTQKESSADSHRDDFAFAIRKAIGRLYSDRYSDNRSREARAQATFARLRQAAGRKPQDDPLAWMEVLDLISPDLPDWCVGKGDAPSPYEEAAFDALTLYALHQRSLRPYMYQKQTSVGAAAAQLAKKTDSASIKPRFDVLMVATSPQAIDHHLRSLFGLFNSHEIPLDHGQLATDLVKLRSPKSRDQVRLRWGRDFARTLYAKTSDK